MAEAIIRFPTVKARTGLSRSTIYRMLSDPESDFPRPISLGARAIGFEESAIDEWIRRRIEQSRKGAA